MSDTEATRLALVGCGAVAEMYHLPALQRLESSGRLQVSAVFDANRELQSLDELSAQGIGLTVVASPPGFHEDHVVAALRAGSSVLCEKPMAVTVAAAESMAAVAAETGRVLCVGLIRRFCPAAQAIRSMIIGRRMGAVRSTFGSRAIPT